MEHGLLNRATGARVEALTGHPRPSLRELAELGDGAAHGEPHGLDNLLDVPVQVGRARISLRELVELAPGSLVALDRKAHEPRAADILVNGQVVAHGEVVTIGDVSLDTPSCDNAYGVRITSV